ncbi:alpha/beta hydrolase [Arenibacter sp. 6A1]|uniref:YqiA/YcfP family alpha/beta fold hydrolase n=1 Tax=Arenibacter sp. 6A1 TaxID=2720391 RepID=UPI0014489CED|nr:YqiA/YcfP family alpha/beta fold hydrolase [Arenibacter sp. 6A1]NKI26427.1 alpha/beta hydrolase [Arenibacter sp. 6A1]
MNILYLHGLESTLSDAKRSLLEKYGRVEAPLMDYKEQNQIFETLFEKYKNSDIDVVMGSSMGGFMGYYLAKALKVPALLFNPALTSRSIVQEIPSKLENSNKYHQVVLGSQDEVVNPMDTIAFLSQLSKEFPLKIHLNHQLGHRIPETVFKQELSAFFTSYKEY